MIDKLIKPGIKQEYLFQVFTEILELEPGSSVLHPEKTIFKALAEGLVEVKLVDDGLTSSACLYLFFDKLNTDLHLDIPDELIQATLTFGSLLLELNRMIEANNLIQVRFNTRTLAVMLQELDSLTISEDILNGSTRKFLKTMPSYRIGYDTIPNTLTSCLETVLYELGLDLLADEQAQLNACKTMIEACKFIDGMMMACRSQNDCRVKFGNSWSRTLQQQTRECLLQFGKYPEGMPMKHITGNLYGNIAKPNSIINDVRVEVEPGHYYIKTEPNLITHFNSLDALLSAGWAVD